MNNDQRNTLTTIVQKGIIAFDAPLSQLTSIKIGGNAHALIKTQDVDEIARIVRSATDMHIPLYILGGGSNLLFADEGYRGIVLKLSPGAEQIERDTKTCRITFPAGYISHLAAQKATAYGCSGFEGMYGLPGTIGGAVYMNSKWPAGHFTTADKLLSIVFMSEDGTAMNLTKDELVFSYGYSVLQKRVGIMLSATFEFELADPKDIQERCNTVMEYRKETQPIGVHTAGCVFKNITDEEKKVANLPTTSAGYLIDQSGLKGERKNGLVVSEKHANFFINESNATAKDFIYLKEKVKEKVYNRFRVVLREEVLIVQSTQ